MSNLAEGIAAEMERVTLLLKEYDQLPNNAGIFGSTIIREDLKNATKALASGDVIAILKAYESLKGIE